VLRRLRARRRTRVSRPSAVVLVTRAGCHLCEQAEPVVARLSAEAGVPYTAQSVDDDPALRQRWTDHVPVVLLDGVEHSRWWVDEAALRRALGLPPSPEV
jgi:glutaredoxin